MSDLQTAIRAQEGKISVARDHLLHYERERGVMEKKFEEENAAYHAVKQKVRQWKDEVDITQRVLQTLREVAGIPVDAPIVRPVQGVSLSQPVQPSPMPKHEEVKAMSHAPFQSDANERHLTNALRKAKGWRVGIPLSPSYAQSPGSFEGQALKRTIADHPGFESYVAAGGHNILDSLAGITVSHMRAACQALGLDPDAIRLDARSAYYDIVTYGESGRHYKW